MLVVVFCFYNICDIYNREEVKINIINEEYVQNSIDINESDKIDINNDSKQELVKLYGIGDKIATRIIKYRENNKFYKISDLIKVKGIGYKTFQKIKNNIKVE